MVEHSAVNRVVVGSSPTRGAYADMAQFVMISERSEIIVGRAG